MAKDIAQIRRDYAGNFLNEKYVGDEPIVFFNKWFDEALAAEVLDANAMVLSTADLNGKPHGRVVLLKGLEDGKFVFYSNYNSAKGQELSQNPNASLTFYYKELDRQIRIEGSVKKCDSATSDEYFDSRPIKSRIGAHISNQSTAIPSRIFLMRRFAEYSLKNIGKKVERPAHWGGYELTPERFEFWQGRPSRLHDRINFTLIKQKWHKERLAP